MRTGNANHRATAGGGRDEQERSSWSAPARAAVILLFGAAVFVVITTGRPSIGVDVGDRSPRDYVARVTFQSTDLERTETARERARMLQPPVFRHQPEAWREGVAEILALIVSDDRDALRERLPEGFPREDFLALVPELRKRVEALQEVLNGLADRYLALPRDLDHQVLQEKLTNRVLLTGPSEESRTVAFSDLKELSGSAGPLREALEAPLGGLPPDKADLARRGLARLLPPTVSPDLERTREAAREAAEQEPEKRKTVDKGRIILAKGSEVRPQHIQDLRSERNRYHATPAGAMAMAERLGGVALLVLILMAASVVYARRYCAELLRKRVQVLAFFFITLVVAALARVCVLRDITPLWVPVPMMVIITSLVYDQRFGMGTAVFFSLLVRLAAPGAASEFTVLLLGGLGAALLSGEVRTRGALIKAGFLTGLVQFLAVWGLGLMGAETTGRIPLAFWQSPLLHDSLAALANGFLGGFIVSGALPLIETLFGVTTDIRLLEWSDPNQPLLQKLLLNAPGTYHHSMLVGSMAAEAAEAVGANPLLARVSAYFHDVGKLKKPEYFAENMPEDGENPHNDLSPTMSNLIITAHPKDGAEMAEKYGVPKEVRDIILQSHGTSVLRYFWHKARGGDQKKNQIREHDFRYRQARPRSKEAAVIMLCDAVESATRSMQSPSPDQVRKTTREIILGRLHDGQLDESGLTITDLKKLEDSLVRSVRAIFHNRVRYPGQDSEQDLESPPEVAPAEGRDSDEQH